MNDVGGSVVPRRWGGATDVADDGGATQGVLRRGEPASLSVLFCETNRNVARLLPFHAAFIALSRCVYCPFALRLLPFCRAFIALLSRVYCPFAAGYENRAHRTVRPMIIAFWDIPFEGCPCRVAFSP